MTLTMLKKTVYGNSTYYFDAQNRYHRTDGPAVEAHKNSRFWTEYYIHGKKHRIDGPATSHPDGDMTFYQNGQKHRHKGPAEIFCDNDKVIYTYTWYVKDLRHRFNAPAVIHITSNSKLYYHYGFEVRHE